MLNKIDVNQIFPIIGKQVVFQQIIALCIWNHTLFMDNSAILVYKIQPRTVAKGLWNHKYRLIN